VHLRAQSLRAVGSETKGCAFRRNKNACSVLFCPATM